MAPTRLHLFLARHPPLHLWCWFVTAMSALIMFRVGEFSFVTLGRWQNVLALLGIVPAALITGWLIGGMAFSVLSSTIFDFEKAHVRWNGGPFKSGDKVVILAGRHRGRVTTVYELCIGQGGPTHTYLRVNLGEQEKADYKDFFAHWQLFRTDG